MVSWYVVWYRPITHAIYVAESTLNQPVLHNDKNILFFDHSADVIHNNIYAIKKFVRSNTKNHDQYKVTHLAFELQQPFLQLIELLKSLTYELPCGFITHCVITSKNSSALHTVCDVKLYKSIKKT